VGREILTQSITHSVISVINLIKIKLHISHKMSTICSCISGFDFVSVLLFGATT